MAYTKYSLTPADNNAAPPNGAPEGMLPSAVNDTMRDMMAQIRDVGDGIRGGTYTMTAPVITGGSITGVALSGNTLTNPVITGGSINNTPIGASTANTGRFSTLEATGVATFSAGTVSAPAITTTGDTNTGIFFPAADTIAFTEGGVESVRITSAGDVGIGLTSPSSKLDVSGLAKANAFGMNATGGSPATGMAAPASDTLALYTNTTERMRITSAGNVGIGTSSPQAKLMVVGEIYASQATSNTQQIRLTPQASGENIIYSTYSGTNSYLPLAFNVGGAERLRIDTSGNVGIGSTSPTATLAIAKSNNFPFMHWNNSSNSTIAFAGWHGGSGGADDFRIGTEVSKAFTFYTNNTERMRIDSSGNVGIGCTPVANLQVNASSDVGIAMSNSSSVTSGNRGSISMYNSGTSTVGYIRFGAVTDNVGTDIQFGTRPAGGSIAERMRIDSSGNVLVGTTSGSYRFMVSSSIADWSASIASTNASSPYGLRLFYSGVVPNNATNQFLYCADTGNTRAEFRSNGGLANYSGNNVNLSDAREKTNVELAGSYLDKICAIPVKTFNYIDQNRDEDDGLTLGVIAQDVQAVAPELVMESNWAAKDQPEKMRLSIYQTDLQYALMKSIQELKAELDSVKAELQTLKGN